MASRPTEVSHSCSCLPLMQTCQFQCPFLNQFLPCTHSELCASTGLLLPVLASQYHTTPRDSNTCAGAH